MCVYMQKYFVLLTSIFRLRLSGLGPWEVVAQGVAGGALGVLQSASSLPAEAPQEAQVLLVETMTGWEARGFERIRRLRNE